MSAKYVYSFGSGAAEETGVMKDILGGKGASLAEMTNLGIPVPAGFTISTEVCSIYQVNGTYPEGLKEDVEWAIGRMEEVMGSRFGDKEDPLLMSARSGARASMPGMMDTVLNLGLNDETVEGLAKRSENERFAWDCYRRLVQMYGDVVLGLKESEDDERDPFELIIEEEKRKKGVKSDLDLDACDLKNLVVRFKDEIRRRLNVEFPSDPMKQLWGAIGAVFGSWNNQRAIAYRELNRIPDDWGTAVSAQGMVFGNMGGDSGTGVAFTRNPATGDNVLYGEYVMNAQGEDVVAGIRTPQPIKRAQKAESDLPSLEEDMPEIYGQLEDISQKLDSHYKDMQDFEFTIERKQLWMLQTRAGKRTGFAACRIAVDLAKKGIIDKEEALKRVEADQLNQLLRPIFDPEEKEKAISEGRFLARGLKAGPGAASGIVVLRADRAEEMARKGEDLILVRIETSPEDIRGMNAAVGILTSRGGMTSHAAVVARQMGKVCVVGCEALQIDYGAGKITVRGDGTSGSSSAIDEGAYISIDGATGEVFSGHIKTVPSEVLQVLVDRTMEPEESEAYQDFAALMSWADEVRRLEVWTNADEADQVRTALGFGAQGIGLCRTEHMFFEGNRIDAMREMILADNKKDREQALEKLLPMQRQDFVEIFRLMDGLPVTIRTLDPPLHEFLPHGPQEIENLAEKMKVPVEKLHLRIDELKELNPMLGHRGCRLGIIYPEITAMQARAIFEAACQVVSEGKSVHPEVMIPLVGDVNELALQRRIVEETAQSVMSSSGVEIHYLVGTMIELPRAALTADKIAVEADFFSFGTNDLTQTTMGLSRDDAGKFLPDYIALDIMKTDPFQELDREGVGQLVQMGTERGRATRPDLKVGICGEHGGDPSSVEFCHAIGLDYVSCSPYRVPIARLAAAQAVLKSKM